MANDEPSTDSATEDERVAGRADLTAEEKAAGSDDPEAQAREILADSDARVASRDAAPGTHLEHRTADEVADQP